MFPAIVRAGLTDVWLIRSAAVAIVIVIVKLEAHFFAAVALLGKKSLISKGHFSRGQITSS
jgi:hypothetical protein